MWLALKKTKPFKTIVLGMFKTTTTLKRFKQYYPLTNSSETFCQRTCVPLKWIQAFGPYRGHTLTIIFTRYPYKMISFAHQTIAITSFPQNAWTNNLLKQAPTKMSLEIHHFTVPDLMTNGSHTTDFLIRLW